MKAASETDGRLEGGEAGAPKVSVVIPHYRDLAALDTCLSALRRQSFPRADFEIVVADNASPEGQVAVAAAIAGRARLVVVEERGAGPARNGGVAASGGAVLAFIDSDCVPEPRWLEEGVRALDDWDIVGGHVRVLVENRARPTPTEAFEQVFAFDFKRYITRKGFTGSGNLFCPRRVFDVVGGFRVGISEDVDWSHRATAAGFRLGYAPSAVVGHPARRTWRDLCSKTARVNAETYGLWKSRKASRVRWLARCLALPASAIVHTPRVLTSRELIGLGQRLSALAVLYRLRLWRGLDCFRLLMSDRPPTAGA